MHKCGLSEINHERNNEREREITKERNHKSRKAYRKKEENNGLPEGNAELTYALYK